MYCVKALPETSVGGCWLSEKIDDKPVTGLRKIGIIPYFGHVHFFVRMDSSWLSRN